MLSNLECGGDATALWNRSKSGGMAAALQIAILLLAVTAHAQVIDNFETAPVDWQAHHSAAIEIVVTAGHGGKGSVWVDELKLSERHVAAVDQPLTFTSSPIEFPEMREFGGLIIDTEARDYDVQIEDAAGNWDTAYSVRRANGKRQYLYMPETEARAIRVAPPSIQKIIVEPVRRSATRNEFFANVAGESTRGDYPRYLYREQSYWTVVGVDGDTSEALISE